MKTDTTFGQSAPVPLQSQRFKAVSIRRIGAADTERLADFYNSLSAASKRTFRPLNDATDQHECKAIIEDNRPGIDRKLDLVAVCDGKIVGWSFLWNLYEDAATLGLAIADDWQGQRLGTRMLTMLVDKARTHGVRHINLTVVKDNIVAQRLYCKFGFVKTGEFVSEEDGLPYWRMAAEISNTEPETPSNP